MPAITNPVDGIIRFGRDSGLAYSGKVKWSWSAVSESFGEMIDFVEKEGSLTTNGVKTRFVMRWPESDFAGICFLKLGAKVKRVDEKRTTGKSGNGSTTRRP